MKRPNILVRFLGLHDKKQKARTKAVSEYVDKKKDEFASEMAKIKNQTKRVHRKQLQVNQETAKLIDIVNDVTKKVMIATGGLKRE